MPGPERRPCQRQGQGRSPLLTEIEERAGTAGYLNVTGIHLEDGPYRTVEDETAVLGDHYEILFRVGYE